MGNLSKSEGKYDLIQTSNITDWMPPADAISCLTGIKECLLPGGVVVSRRLNGDYGLEDVIEKAMYTDRELNAMLLRRDRSFFYAEVIAGFNQ